MEGTSTRSLLLNFVGTIVKLQCDFQKNRKSTWKSFGTYGKGSSSYNTHKWICCESFQGKLHAVALLAFFVCCGGEEQL